MSTRAIRHLPFEMTNMVLAVKHHNVGSETRNRARHEGAPSVRKIEDRTTIGGLFASAVSSYARHSFLAIPGNNEREYLKEGLEISYEEAGRCMAELSVAYKDAGLWCR